MSGPIVRSGPSSEYTRNWDNIFASGKSTTAKKKQAVATTGKKKAAKRKKK